MRMCMDRKVSEENDETRKKLSVASGVRSKRLERRQPPRYRIRRTSPVLLSSEMASRTCTLFAAFVRSQFTYSLVVLGDVGFNFVDNG